YRQSTASVEAPRTPINTGTQELTLVPRKQVTQGLPATPRPVASERAVGPKSESGTELSVARSLADQGKLNEAAKACEAHLRTAGSSAEAWCLLGVIRGAKGENRRAADCYRKAIYLEPGHA